MPKPKYRQWLEDVAGMRGQDVNEMIRDNTYNYEHFYNAQPKEAQAMLKRNADAHFTDIAKTAFHPTFSVELVLPNDSYPIIDCIKFGGVLLEITIIGKRKTKK